MKRLQTSPKLWGNLAVNYREKNGFMQQFRQDNGDRIYSLTFLATSLDNWTDKVDLKHSGPYIQEI